MGQLWGADSGGAQGSRGQTHGQTWKPGGRWVQRNIYGAMGPTELARKPPLSGGGGMMPADVGGSCSPAATFGGLWNAQEN